MNVSQSERAIPVLARATPTLACACLALTSACAFEPGDPWARAEMSLTVRFDPSERTDAQGRLRTAKDFALDELRVALDIESIGTRVHISSGETVAFDPANPPPGFSLCHNGHCHAADGSLVDYEAIQAMLSGGDQDFTRSQRAVPGLEPLTPEGHALALEPCPDRCDLVSGVASGFEMRPVVVAVSGRAFDLRTEGRLPEDGRTFTSTLTLDALRLEVALEARLDNSEPAGLRIDGDYATPAAMFDGVDFAADAIDFTPIRQALLEHPSALSTSMARFELERSQ